MKADVVVLHVTRLFTPQCWFAVLTTRLKRLIVGAVKDGEKCLEDWVVG